MEQIILDICCTIKQIKILTEFTNVSADLLKTDKLIQYIINREQDIREICPIIKITNKDKKRRSFAITIIRILCHNIGYKLKAKREPKKLKNKKLGLCTYSIIKNGNNIDKMQGRVYNINTEEKSMG